MYWQGSRRRAVGVVVAVAMTFVVAAAAGAEAALVPVSSTTTTTSTTAPPARSGPTTPTTPVAPAPAGGSDTAPSGAVPAAIVAKVNSVRRTAPNSTGALLAALAPLAPYGLNPTQQALVGFGRFPVAGPAHWSDDWWMPRHDADGTWRVHEGVDIFAPLGTPVRAPVDGSVQVSNGGLGGLAITVRQPDGTYWYLCHLAAIAVGMANGVAVKTGQVVGFVGNSGDAAGGPTHLHFEVHPRGGAAVPPKPVIDRFVADALARVPALLDAYAQANRNGSVAAPAAADPAPALPALTAQDALLWVSAANPAGGTLRLVQAAALDAARRIDWSTRH